MSPGPLALRLCPEPGQHAASEGKNGHPNSHHPHPHPRSSGSLCNYFSLLSDWKKSPLILFELDLHTLTFTPKFLSVWILTNDTFDYGHHNPDTGQFHHLKFSCPSLISLLRQPLAVTDLFPNFCFYMRFAFYSVVIIYNAEYLEKVSSNNAWWQFSTKKRKNPQRKKIEDQKKKRIFLIVK